MNQQIARELSEQTEQISQNPESSRFASNEQVEQLRNELIATRAENDQNLRRINEFQSTHQTMQRTYDELVERYSALQQVSQIHSFNINDSSIQVLLVIRRLATSECN